MSEADRFLDHSFMAMEVGERVRIIIIALSKVAANADLSRDDIDGLTAGLDLLTQLENSLNWLTETKVGPQAKAYNFYLQAAPEPWRAGTVNYTEDISTYRNTVLAVKDKTGLDQEDLQNTRNFFDNVFQMTIDNFGKIPAPQVITDVSE